MKYILRFITSDDSVLLELESPTITDFEQTEIIRDLRYCSSTHEQGANCFALRMSDVLKSLYAKLKDKYGKAYPKFNAVVALVNRTPNGKILTVVFNEPWDVKKEMGLQAFMEEQEGGKPAKETVAEYQELFGEVLDHYHFITADPRKFMRIGEQERTKRVCRFCGKMMPDTTFESDSHSISEALGNKNFITNDECDECNSRFGKGDGIENDFLNMLAPQITIFGVKGKKHIPNFEGKDFRLIYEGIKEEGENPTIHLEVMEEKPEPMKDSVPPIHLETERRCTPQNVYRVLCKYAIGMLPTQYVQYFKKTIEWINGTFDASYLPPVKYWFMNQRVIQPELTVVLRIDDDTSIPFAFAEFTALNMKYIYLIPFANDEECVDDREMYDHWWSLLKYAHSFPWREDNYTSTVPRKLNFNFHFHEAFKNKI